MKNIDTKYANYIFEIIDSAGNKSVHSVTAETLGQARADMMDLLDEGEAIINVIPEIC